MRNLTRAFNLIGLFAPVVACASAPSPRSPLTQSANQMHGSMMKGSMMQAQMMQGPMMMGGWHFRSPYGKQYFTGTETTLTGTVIEMGVVIPQPHMMRGTQIVIKTETGKRSIHLGPDWYIREQDIKLKQGDKITVRGMLIGEGEQAFIIAAEISKDGQTWALRDKEGLPYWCANRAPLTPEAPAKKPAK